LGVQRENISPGPTLVPTWLPGTWTPAPDVQLQILRSGFLEKRRLRFINFAKQNENCITCLKSRSPAPKWTEA
jgi:hypothetical protein